MNFVIETQTVSRAQSGALLLQGEFKQLSRGGFRDRADGFTLKGNTNKGVVLLLPSRILHDSLDISAS